MCSGPFFLFSRQKEDQRESSCAHSSKSCRQSQVHGGSVKWEHFWRRLKEIILKPCCKHVSNRKNCGWMWKSPDCSSVIWILALSFFGIYLVTHLLNNTSSYVFCLVFFKNQNQNCLCTLFLRIVTCTVIIAMFMHVCIPWYVFPSTACCQSPFMTNHMTHPKSFIVLQFVWQWNLYLIKLKKNNIFLLFNAFILTQIWGSGSAYKLHQVA